MSIHGRLRTPLPDCLHPSDAPPGGQNLPSLHTLLQSQLMDSRAPAPSSPPCDRRLPAPGQLYGSSSPTLKRRNDGGLFGPGRLGGDARATRAPPVLHAPQQYQGVLNPISSHVPEFLRHPPQNFSDPMHSLHSPPYAGSGFSAFPTSVTHLSTATSRDETFELSSRPRYETLLRAPASSSRYVGQREIPGEGMCYIYEDGSFCRVVIDGEPVNPSWGITKAGKPRKRLAQACLTCREKKIKCEPAIPKCHQCAKSQRVCRGGRSQSSSQDEHSPSGNLAITQVPKSEQLSIVTGRTNTAWEARSSTQPPLKAGRPTQNSTAWDSGSPMEFRSTSPPIGGILVPQPWDVDLKEPISDSMPSSRHSLLKEDRLESDWEQDPYELDSRLTASLLDLYFTHVGCATYAMFPRKQFTFWVESCREKSQDDRMLLYSLLAMGSVFASDSVHRTIGKRFSDIAAYALKKKFGKFSLQLCQSRMMLALFYFSRGKAAEAWDLCGAGFRAISALRLNTEAGIKSFSDDDLDFGFDRPTLEECRRRTFWSGFLMDRYNMFSGGTVCVLHLQDTFIRLPCLEIDYGSSHPREAPLFHIEILKEPLLKVSLGLMAYLTLISAIWGEVLMYTSRAAAHQLDHSYSQLYEEFYGLTYERLDAWRNNLPSHLYFTPSNFDDSIAAGYSGTFISLHALYHVTQMKLNRHARTTLLSPFALRRSIYRANLSANEFISIMLALPRPKTISDHNFLVPFPGYTLMFAVDIVTASGTVAGLPALMQLVGATVPAVAKLAGYWASAKAQHKAISSRLKQLAEIALSERDSARRGPYWRLSGSLETSFTKRDDLIYGIDDHVLFETMKQEV